MIIEYCIRLTVLARLIFISRLSPSPALRANFQAFDLRSISPFDHLPGAYLKIDWLNLFPNALCHLLAHQSLFQVSSRHTMAKLRMNTTESFCASGSSCAGGSLCTNSYLSPLPPSVALLPRELNSASRHVLGACVCAHTRAPTSSNDTFIRLHAAHRHYSPVSCLYSRHFHRAQSSREKNTCKCKALTSRTVHNIAPRRCVLLRATRASAVSQSGVFICCTAEALATRSTHTGSELSRKCEEYASRVNAYSKILAGSTTAEYGGAATTPRAVYASATCIW